MNGMLLQARGLQIVRGGRRVLTIDSLTLQAGERVLLEGQVGAGKSSLLLTLAGLLPRAAGHIEWFGVERHDESSFAPIRGRLGLLFQDPDDPLIGPTVLEDVEFGPLNLGHSPARAHERAEETLEALGVLHLADRPIHDLSAGEKKLVALAGWLAMDSEVLLLDEPSAGWDAATLDRVLVVLRSRGISWLAATHEAPMLAAQATRRLRLSDGCLSAG